MNLEEEEINAIAYVLDEKIGDEFHEACWSIIKERTVNYDFEVSDEDVMKIKMQLAKMMNYE